jgi:hypothetical protein
LAKVVAGGGMLYNSPISVTAKIPDGTKFRIIDLQDGVLEAVGEGVDYYDYENKRDLRKKYRGQ